MGLKTIQISISVVALIFAGIHLAWPDLAIDTITLSFLILAALPWIAPLLKSVELPGGVKIEFKDLEKTRLKAEKVGLLAEPAEYKFQLMAEEDPSLALAGLRIEIEKRLKQIAEAKGLPIQRKGVGTLLRLLREKDVLTHEQYGVLAEMVGLMNSAVHGASVDSRAAEWAMEVGPRILKALDDKLES